MQGLLQCMMRQVRHAVAHDTFEHARAAQTFYLDDDFSPWNIIFTSFVVLWNLNSYCIQVCL